MPSNDPIQIWIWHKYQSISQYNVCFFIPQFLAQHNVYHLKNPIKIGRSPPPLPQEAAGWESPLPFFPLPQDMAEPIKNQWDPMEGPESSPFFGSKKHRQVMLVPGTNNEFFLCFFPYCPVVL
jgi:hypothetical protein